LRKSDNITRLFLVARAYIRKYRITLTLPAYDFGDLAAWSVPGPGDFIIGRLDWVTKKTSHIFDMLARPRLSTLELTRAPGTWHTYPDDQ